MITYFPLIFLGSRLGTDYQGSKILVTSSGCWGFSEALEVRVPLLWAFQQAVHTTEMELSLSRLPQPEFRDLPILLKDNIAGIALICAAVQAVLSHLPGHT